VNRWIILLLLVFATSACGRSAKSEKSYDQIRKIVSGKTAAEVQRLLGPPDTRKPLLLGDERWTWWDYTYLGGKDWAPEVRGKVVHLEITFESPSLVGQGGDNKAEWRVSEPYGVGFSFPDGGDNPSLPLNKKTRRSI